MLTVNIEGYDFNLVMLSDLLLETPGVVVVQVTVDGVGKIVDVFNTENPLATINNHPEKDIWEIVEGGKVSFAVHYNDNEGRRKKIFMDVQRSLAG